MLTMHSHHWNWRLPSFPYLTWDTQNLKRKLEDGSKIWSPFSTIWSLSSLFLKVLTHSVSSVTQLCPILSDPMNYSTPGFPVHHHFLDFPQTHVHRVSDAIQASYPLSPLSSPALNPTQHQDLFQWVGSLHQVAELLELQHQSFQWILR